MWFLLLLFSLLIWIVWAIVHVGVKSELTVFRK